MAKLVKCDVHFKRPSTSRRLWKRLKNRIERHRAKHNPECNPAYGRYWKSMLYDWH